MSPLKNALNGKCPACNKGGIFCKLVKLKPKCDECGFDFSKSDHGDGPASLSVFLIGFLISVAAVVIEMKYEPAYWVHAVLWLPATIILSCMSLRWCKGFLLALYYKHNFLDGNNND